MLKIEAIWRSLNSGMIKTTAQDEQNGEARLMLWNTSFHLTQHTVLNKAEPKYMMHYKTMSFTLFKTQLALGKSLLFSCVYFRDLQAWSV